MFSSSNSRPRILAPPMTILVMVATLLLLAIPQSSAFKLFHRPHYHVHVINNLSDLTNSTMLVHCFCTDEPQPVAYVPVGGEYVWAFRRHIFRSTEWTCYVAPDMSRYAQFVAYDDDTYTFDKEVYWVAKEDGIYMRYPDQGNLDLFRYDWSRNLPPFAP
ncbi:hypothetical protein LINPERHAP2_LOCUS13950 [Linum perenne]